MRFAVYCANFGALGDPRTLVDLALRAEASGWDGFFVYDHVVIAPGRPVASADPWTVLAAVADRTALILGPMVTPLARRQPWEVAHQALTLDHLSGGRLILGFGLGEAMDHHAFGTPPSLAARFDEGLELVVRLVAGETVDHRGSWTLRNVTLAPPPRRGSIPIWIAGRWPAGAPIRRAARHAGMFPINRVWDLDDPLTPAQLTDVRRRLSELGAAVDGYDLVTAGVSPPDRQAAGAMVARYARAGATWWLEILEPRRGDPDALRRRVDAGPPARQA